MRRCLLRLGPAAAVDPRGVELLCAHLSAVFLCGAFSPAASPLPTHQLREGTDFLAPLPILLHSLRSRGDKHWALKSKPGSVAVSALAAIVIYFYPPLPLSLALSTHATQLLPLNQTGLNLKRTRRHFVISEISSSLFSSLWRQLATGSEPRAVRGPTARGETRSAFTFRSARGLHPNIYCMHGVINLPALSSRRCRSCVKAESLHRRWIILTDSFWRIS